VNLTGKGPLGLKDRANGKDPAWMARVAQLPCVICHHYGYEQLSRTQVHHCIHGRYSARKAPDRTTIPLCEGCHVGLRDTSKLAIHQAPSQWRRVYGADTDWISWVEQRLNQE